MLNCNRKNRGFTLIEVVISLALSGLILTAMMSLFVGFVHAWQTQKTPYENFINHVDNCVRFLSGELNESVLIRTGKSLTTKCYKAVKLVQGEYVDKNNVWVLGGFVSNALPFSHETNTLAWRVLMLSPAGLCLRWEMPEVSKKRMSDGTEVTGNTTIKFFILSPYVTQLEYAHYDREKGRWEFVTSLEDYCNKFNRDMKDGRPDGVRLKFSHNDWEEERFILLNNDPKPLKQLQSKKTPNEKAKHEK